MGIDTTGIDLAILLETVDKQFTTHQLCDVTTVWRRVVHVVLEFMVHPSAVLNLMCPVGLVQLRTFVEFILPHQRIALRGIVSRLLSSSLGHGDSLAGRTRHDCDSTRAGLSHRISRNRDGERTRLGCRVLGLYGKEVVAHSSTPLFSRRRDVHRVGTTFSGCTDCLWRDGESDGRRCRVVLAPSAAHKGHGEREQKTTKHVSFHYLL